MRKLGILGTILGTFLSLAAPARAQYFSYPNTYTDFTNCGSGCSAGIMANYNQLISTGNSSFSSLQSAIAALGSAGPPGGMIAYFNSAYTSCPNGWSTADGTQGTVDARGVFVRGLDLGGLRGPVTVLGAYYVDNIQQHQHSMSTVSMGGGSLAGSPGSGFFAVTSFSTASITVGATSTVGVAGLETRPYGYLLTACQATGIGGGGTSLTFAPPPATMVNGLPIQAAQLMQNFNQFTNDGNAAYSAIQAAISGISAGAVPSGAVAPFMLSSCPSGWVASDGTASTVDLRGYFVRVWNSTATPPDASRTRNSTQGFATAAHSHSTGSSYTNAASTGSISNTGTGSSYPSFAGAGGGAGNINSVNTSGSGGGVGTETRPKFLALLYCQKS